jgi:RNA polymerase sigma-70 factor (ECF subfamily)
VTASLTLIKGLPSPTGGETRDDAWLVARCRGGDQNAFRLLYEAHARKVMAHASRLGMLRSEVEDVAQDVFTALFQELPRLRPETLDAWLYRLTSNRVNDRHRRRRVRETFARMFGGGEVDPPESTEGPEEALQRREAEGQVRRILAKMSQKKRDVFVMFEIEKIPGEEIAERLGIPLATVWTRLHHARHEFAKIARALEGAEQRRSPGGRP